MIEATVATAGSGRITLIGSSLGGLVASHASLQLDVAALVVMAPAFRFARRWESRLGRERVKRWAAGEHVVVEDHSGGPDIAVDYDFYRDAAAIDESDIAIEVPMLVFHGRQDDVVPIAGSRDFVARTPSAQLVELDDGHALTNSIDRMLPRAAAFIEQHA